LPTTSKPSRGRRTCHLMRGSCRQNASPKFCDSEFGGYWLSRILTSVSVSSQRLPHPYQSPGTDRRTHTILAPTTFTKYVRHISATHSGAFPSTRSRAHGSKASRGGRVYARAYRTMPKQRSSCPVGSRTVPSSPKLLASSRTFGKTRMDSSTEEAPCSLRITELRGPHQAYNSAERLIRFVSAKAVSLPLSTLPVNEEGFR